MIQIMGFTNLSKFFLLSIATRILLFFSRIMDTEWMNRHRHRHHFLIKKYPFIQTSDYLDCVWFFSFSFFRHSLFIDSFWLSMCVCVLYLLKKKLIENSLTISSEKKNSILLYIKMIRDKIQNPRFQCPHLLNIIIFFSPLRNSNKRGIRRDKKKCRIHFPFATIIIIYYLYHSIFSIWITAIIIIITIWNHYGIITIIKKIEAKNLN